MLHTTRTQRFLIFVCGAFTLPLLAIADGQHNDKTCYAETAGGIEISSSCSSRNTTCNDDFTCSIDGVAGEMKNGLEMNKADIISEIAEKTDATDGKVGKAASKPKLIRTPAHSKATGHNSSRSNKTSSNKAQILDPDDDGDSIPTSGNRATDYNSSRSNKADGKSKQDSDDDGDSISTGGNRATDYNSSRSNKADGNLNQDSDGDADDADTDEDTKATDYNSSRSNKSYSSSELIDETDTDVNKSKSIAGGDDCDDDCDSDVGANHNSTRSNKTKPVAEDSGDADSDSDGDDTDADEVDEAEDEAQDYNSSRSNRG